MIPNIARYTLNALLFCAYGSTILLISAIIGSFVIGFVETVGELPIVDENTIYGFCAIFGIVFYAWLMAMHKQKMFIQREN